MQEHSGANKRCNDQLEDFDSPILKENYLELMENRLSSSEIFPRTYFIGDPPDRKIKTLNLENLKDGSSSCQCSLTKRGNSEKCISNSEQVKEYAIPARTLDIPRPWRRKEVARNSQLHTWRKMGFYHLTDGGTSQTNQCFKHRTLVSHDSLSKSALYPRSSLKLVWRVRSKAGWERVDFGKLRDWRMWSRRK